MLKRWAAWSQAIRWLAGGIAAVVVGLAIARVLFVPAADWLARHDVGSARGPLLQTARDAARGRLLTLGAGLFAAGALLYTARNLTLSRRTFQLTEQGQVTDRYTKAIEQLGSDKLDVRIGGIYALERVARDSARDHPPVMAVLAAFIREHSREPLDRLEPGAEMPEPPEPTTRPDVQAAVTVIGRRVRAYDIRPIDLTGAALIRADLQDADLSGALLYGAQLTRANLTGANVNFADLTGAYLTQADLTDAHLVEANLRVGRLSEAKFTRANLTSAILSGAILNLADFAGAELYGAILTNSDLTHANLTGARLENANLGWAILATRSSPARSSLVRTSPRRYSPRTCPYQTDGCWTLLPVGLDALTRMLRVPVTN